MGSDEDLAAFVAARLDEDEAAARDWQPHERYPDDPDEMGARWNLVPTYTPARVLREVAAKRAMLAAHDDNHDCADLSGTEFPYVGCSVVRQLATAWNGHPDYREEWKP